MSNDFFDDIYAALEDNTFEEKPVDVKTFVEGEDFLAQPPLSDIQYGIVEYMSQIYREEDLIKLMGEEAGREHYKHYTKNELILCLGKGTNIGSTKSWSPEFGWKRIDEKLEDFGLIQSINSVNGATAFYSEGTDHVFKVTTKFGYSFTGNAGHKMFGWKNTPHSKTYSTKKDPYEIPIAELEKGDIAVIYGGWEESENPYEVTCDEARLIGYMIGDGTWVKNGAKGKRNPCFTNATKEVQDDILRIVESIGGSVRPYLSGAGCWAIAINGITDWFVKHGLIQDYNTFKSWNDQWMNMSSENLAQLINGLWATDGWGSIQDSEIHGKPVKGLSIAIEMNSESIVSGLHMALLRLGIISSFRNNRQLRGNGKHNPTWRVSICNRHFVKKFIDVVGIPIGKNEKFNEIYRLADEKQYKNLESNGNILKDRIASIEYVGEEEVFACTVETGHNYLGDGFIHGNSGKDYVSTIAVAYIVYKLLCLTDPAKYYGKPMGDAIDIMNVAINANQARNVFFKGFKSKIEKSQWFQGRYNSKTEYLEFDKSITVYSGHSERESHEGLNLFIAILDEISGFAIESTSGHALAKTADGIYKAFRGTVDSRFPDLGKVVLLSFPRYKEDYISQKYNEAIADKDVVMRDHKFRINDDLPDGLSENEFTITWEEDHITMYALPRVFALKRPTWEVNPTRKIEDFRNAFYSDPEDALQRFAAQPPEAEGGYFKDHNKIDNTFSLPPAIEEGMAFQEWFRPKDETRYFMHVDLAQKNDRCAVAMAHVDSWIHTAYVMGNHYYDPVIVVDFVYWWTPSKAQSVNFDDVRDFIVGVKRSGFDLRAVTFDRWSSHTMMMELNALGIRAENLSVAKKHYDDFKMALMQDHVRGPEIELLRKELKQLRIIKDKVDHVRTGGKDLADAVCGAVFNAISRTPRDDSSEVVVMSLADKQRTPQTKDNQDGVIKPPPAKMPEELKEYLGGLTLI